jgi:hypothetical protein
MNLIKQFYKNEKKKLRYTTNTKHEKHGKYMA